MPGTYHTATLNAYELKAGGFRGVYTVRADPPFPRGDFTAEDLLNLCLAVFGTMTIFYVIFLQLEKLLIAFKSKTIREWLTRGTQALLHSPRYVAASLSRLLPSRCRRIRRAAALRSSKPRIAPVAIAATKRTHPPEQ